MHLQLRLKTKIILCAILSMSSLAIAAAILRTIQLQLMTSSSVSYAYAMWSIWFLTEGTVIIVTASVPRIRPIMTVRKRPTRVMYDRVKFRNEASTQCGALTRETRLKGSVYKERLFDGAPAYPTPVVMRWNNDSGSDGQDLIALEQQISASHSMQKFKYS
ncbi:hypothetical protein BJX68DRAFT_267325 [Aspergillus pseudodeflectus]|uniref:Rhodopsin domain-containing protein n=1 Tax=Aspergillus pseudodeflectus TaxID=176178 RepID=A0ABR4K9L5_9EURO